MSAIISNMRRCRQVWGCERGATAIEYALVAGLISLTIIIWAANISGSLNEKFDSVNNGFSNK